MVQLLDLPAELLREIFIHSVNVHLGLQSGLRLRLVNRLFSQEITQALIASPMLDEYIIKHHYLEGTKGPHYDAFWQAYLTTRILSRRGPFLPLVNFVYKVAERLCEVTGDQTTKTLQRFVYELCYSPCKMLQSYCPRAIRSRTEPSLWHHSRFLLQAAMITGCSDVVDKLLNGPDFPAAFSPTCMLGHFEPWETAVYLAAERGQTQILGKVFLDKRLDTRELREVAISAAIKTGNLPLIEFIMDTRWGPVDFFSSSLCVDENLVSGTLNSSHMDFSARLFALFASRATMGYPIEIHEPYSEEILYNVAFYKPQRVDVAQWLLDRAAELPQEANLQDAVGGRDRHARKIWNTLCRAVQGRNEQMMLLFLDHGADPNIMDEHVATNGNVPLRAEFSGRLQLVRMLAEHGANVRPYLKARQRLSCGPKTYSSMANYVVSVSETSYRKKMLYKRCIVGDEDCVMDALPDTIEWKLEGMIRFLLGNGAEVTGEMVNRVKRLNWPFAEQLLQSALERCTLE